MPPPEPARWRPTASICDGGRRDARWVVRTQRLCCVGGRGVCVCGGGGRGGGESPGAIKAGLSPPGDGGGNLGSRAVVRLHTSSMKTMHGAR
eukprot:6699628-Prymnesium_polylepis.1